MTTTKRTPEPPRWATAFLGWYCRPELLEDLEGDLRECFEKNLQTKSVVLAKFIYAADVLKFLRSYTIRKPSFFSFFIHYIMIGSYIKTSGRSLVRNKLFSLINIAGLAVAMSIGLIMVSFVSDILSYDSFQKNKDRIFRVTSFTPDPNAPDGLATTSRKLGTDLLESGSGFESVVLMGNGFGGDAEVEKKVIPIHGLWANESVFKVFSFSLLQGNPATALKEPYSLVLSETIAKKMFGTSDAYGKAVKIGKIAYTVTGVMHDVPKFSHMRPEVFASISTQDILEGSTDPDFKSWTNIYSHYIYALVPESGPSALQASLNLIAQTENKITGKTPISLRLQPMTNILLKRLGNPIGRDFPVLIIWIMSGLALIVILSACFNYTNLSIARSMRRGREVGIRKVIGASRSNVLAQFIAEAVILALISLVVALGLFLFLRTRFLALNPMIADLVSLELSAGLIAQFVAMTVLTGILAGFLPALFFSKINAVKVLKDVSSIKVFKSISLRKAMIVVQYCFSLMFITSTIIGYNQYKGFVKFDLGFKTENILNIKMQGNKNAALKKELLEIPGVEKISASRLITSLGSLYGTHFLYNNNQDTAQVMLNAVDENYLAQHDHTLIAGRNFNVVAEGQKQSEVIISEDMLRHFNLGSRDPWKVIGVSITVDNNPLTIVGVVKDFHYGTVEKEMMPIMFLYSSDETWGYLGVTINSSDLPSVMGAIETAWRKTDSVHPLDAGFYDDQIEKAYNQFSVMVKVIGFLSFLAICIASMGLFGMVVFTTETRLKEISIRKVLGASEGKLIFLLSRGFIVLLLIAAAIALPATYLFFDTIVLSNFAFHDPIKLTDVLLGFAGVSMIAFLMIGSQTLRAASSNPADVLKNE